MTDEEKKVAAANKKKSDTSNFRNSTSKAIARLKLSNQKLTANAIAKKKKTIASNKKRKKDLKRQYVSDKYTRIVGLQGLQGLQGLSPKNKKS